MRGFLRCVGLGLALVLLPALFAQDKKADADKAADKDKKADADKPADKDKKMDADKNPPKDKKEALEKMQVGGQVTGKLTQWGASDKSFTVEVTLTYYTVNDGEYKAMLQEQVYAADPRRSAQDRLNHATEAAKHQARLYTPKKENVHVGFVPASDMKVRTLNPLVFDDKGKPKTLTKKEKDELKGPDKSLPGYTAELSDVRQDSYVTVYLPKKKPAKTAPAKDDKGLADNKAEAAMIVIVGDAAPPK
jgi:hypothetical protein